MPQAATNRVRIGIVEESAFGVTPASPTFETVRFRDAGLAGDRQTVESEEIIVDRMTADFLTVGVESAGPVGIEWIGGETYRLPVEGALGNTMTKSSERQGATVITAVGTGAYTVTDTGGNLAPGHLIKASSFAETANNGVFAAEASTTNTSVKRTGVVTETPAGTAVRLKVIGIQGASGDITAVTAGGNGLGSTAWNWTTAGNAPAPGQWLKIGKAGDAAMSFQGTVANNGYARVSLATAATSTKLFLDIVPTGWAVDTAAGKTIRLYWTDHVKNGTTVKSYAIERYFADIGKYEYFNGIVAAQLAMELRPRAIVTGAITFMGTAHVAQDSQFASAANRAATTYGVTQTSSNVARITEGGTAITGPNYVLGLTLTVNNNGRTLPAIGSLGGIGANFGRLQVGGTLETYFGDLTLLNKVVNSTQTALDWAIVNTEGDGLHVDIPKAKLGAGSPTVSGGNAEVTTPFNWMALKYTPGLTSVSPFAISLSFYESVNQ